MSEITRFVDGHGFVACSFCGKLPSQVKGMVAGPTAFICNECVRLCGAVIASECMDSPPSPPLPTGSEEKDVG